MVSTFEKVSVAFCDMCEERRIHPSRYTLGLEKNMVIGKI